MRVLSCFYSVLIYVFYFLNWGLWVSGDLYLRLDFEGFRSFMMIFKFCFFVW